MKQASDRAKCVLRPCSGVGASLGVPFANIGMGFGEKTREFRFDHAGIHAFEDRNNAFKHHFAASLFLAHAILDFSSYRKKEKVGGSDAIDGSHKGDRDPTADFVDVVEMLHDLNQAQDGADDADGG